MVSLNIYKNSANKFIRKTGFKIENEIEDQDQSIPKLIGILTQVFCTLCPNLVILAWTGDELSYREAQNGVNFDFEVKFDLEGQGQSPPKTIGILTKVFYTYGPNLVILAWTGDELSRGQASDYRTHGRTDTQTDAGNDNTRRPKLASGKNWKPWVVTMPTLSPLLALQVVSGATGNAKVQLLVSNRPHGNSSSWRSISWQSQQAMFLIQRCIVGAK